MFNELRKIIDEHSENFNKEVEHILESSEMKNSRTDIKNH